MSGTLKNETLKGFKRSMRCGELTGVSVGRKVTVMGWVHRRRNLGSMIFVDLRDRTGLLQIVFYESGDKELFETAQSLRSEFVVAVTGTVIPRTGDMINTRMPTGEVEVKAEELRVLSRAETTPIPIAEDQDVNEALRLKYRYLDLRKPEMQQSFVLRHQVTKITRDYFDSNGFLEIETPILTKSTPEGARDYLVPSRIHHGSFYALPQSPQLFKQLLMVSGFDRYLQIAKCFRDEDLRADRQPEFTQIDLEMSFVDMEDVLEINEGFLCTLFKEVMNVTLPRPFPRMTYAEAMARYGSDKPDTRFGLELCDLTDLAAGCGFKVFEDAANQGGRVFALNIPGGAKIFSRRDTDALVERAKTYGARGMSWMAIEEGGVKSSIAKFLTEQAISGILSRACAKTGDLILFVADRDSVVYAALGGLRTELGQKLDLIDPGKYHFLWITEFPLLDFDPEAKRYIAMHHPFTSPMDEDIPLLDTDPGKARAKAYDIVLNGVELGGGSIRIHQQELQSRMFDLLGFTRERAWQNFGFLLEAFRYGTPPHGGIAYGLDRLVMLLSGKTSIRDVIAFPKVQNASCLLSGAPDRVDAQQLKELHIRTIEETPD